MKKHILIFLLVFLLAPIKSYATNALGDANDETSLYMWGGGAISANFKDKSAKVSYFHSKSDKPLGAGITLKGKSTNNNSVIFDGQDVTPETTITIPIGYHWVFSEKVGRIAPNGFIKDDWIFIDVKYTVGEYQMYDSSNAFDKQLYKEKMKAPSLVLSYNAVLSGNVLIGASLEFGKTNNYTSLKSKNIKTLSNIEISNSITRSSESSVTAKEGEYNEYNQTKFNVDAMFIPGYFDNRVGFDIFARFIDSSSQDTSFLNPGIGVFLLKDGAPTKIIGGITFMRDDEENENIVGVVVGYNY